MSLKKQNFKDDEEIAIDDAIVYKRGDYWQMRLWLAKEKKYARFSLRTRNKATALDKAKKHYYELMAQQYAGKTYFSKTTKQGVAEYLEQRGKDVELGRITKGRLGTIKTHLEHWLEYIGRDTKLKELERTDCEDYLYARTKTKKNISVSQITVANEYSTINAMMHWLYKHKETYIEAFDFLPIKKVDAGDDANRRSIFTEKEIEAITMVIDEYTKEAEKDITGEGNLIKAIAGYYLGVAMITGLRRGEQLQLKWGDLEELERVEGRGKGYRLIKINVRYQTSKVRKSRKFVVKDFGYFQKLLQLTRLRHGKDLRDKQLEDAVSNEIIFSKDGTSAITARAIAYHFDRVVKLAKIGDLDKRDLVPYSFRHTFITKRVNSNLPPAAVAEMCGTSITQIERTYYHTTDEKMISNALADYKVVQGMLVPR